ncbi:MAG: SocA family protein [Armatimonadetes bacterium]|nr:SocA family protein [Armatimonadota bacterium]
MSDQVISDPLEAVICQILRRERGAGVTRLMKLLYLAELTHFRRYGRPLTGARFINYDYGPICLDAYRALERLAAKGAIEEHCHTTRDGQTCRLQMPVMTAMHVEPASPYAIEVVDQVVDEWQDRSSAELVSYAKSTAPFTASRYNEELDLSLAAPTPFSSPADVDWDATLPDVI